MADLSSGVGQARTQNGRTGAGATLPVPSTGTPRVRSPRDIMRDREKREALRRLEQEQQNRVRTGRSTTDQTAGVGVSGDGGGDEIGTENRRSGGRPQYGTQIQDKDRRSTDAALRGNTLTDAQPITSTTGRGETQRQVEGGTRSTSQPLQPQRIRSGRTATRAAAAAAEPQQPQQQQQSSRAASGPAATGRNQSDPRTQPTANTQTRNSSTTFPHAFERWETLSSHWEGLTNFWIKRLQTNSDELQGQPINQQLARQVTDLSAAGANLFHAVVELQRLRASSERKFQRWFFETRAEQEKTAERIAQLEAELASARQGIPIPVQADAPRQPSPEEIQKQAQRLAADEIEKVKRQCALEIKEKNRELEISREEARRGWEEIGRMEQENRDRTFSLRHGQPTVLGGVQVVPLSTTETSRATRGQSGGLSSHPPPATAESGYTGYDATRSETDTDPFTESGRDIPATAQKIPVSPRQPSSSSAAIQAARTRGASASPARPQTAGQPFASSSVYATEPLTAASAGGFYQQSGAGTSLHPQSRPTGQEYIASDLSEEEYREDDNGQGLRDQHGARTNPSSEISDEYDVLDQLERDQLFTRGYPADYGQPPRHATTSNGGSYPGPADYSGSGYDDRDWPSAAQRHHHPSRLSDVLEEDERSRTSETSRRFQQH